MDKEKVDSRRKEKYERRKNLTLLELWKLGRKGASSLFIPLISCPEHHGACLTGRNQKFRGLEQLAHRCPGVLSTSPVMGKSDLLPNGAYKGFIKCPDSPHGTHPCLSPPPDADTAGLRGCLVWAVIHGRRPGVRFPFVLHTSSQA